MTKPVSRFFSRSVLTLLCIASLLFLLFGFFLTMYTATFGAVFLLLGFSLMLFYSYCDLKYSEWFSLTHLFSAKDKSGFIMSVIFYILLYTLAFLLAFPLITMLPFLDTYMSTSTVLTIYAIFLYLFPAFIYTWRSLLAKNDMVICANSIMSVLLFALLEVKSSVVNLLSIWYSIDTFQYTLVLNSEYATPQFFDFMVSIMLLPLFFLFTFGTIISLGKQYWIKNYNDNNDIERY